MDKNFFKNKKLNILTVCQYGYPEPYPSLYPMEQLIKRGHKVHAVLGMPNYPMGDIYEGFNNKKINFEIHNNIKIAHVPIVPRKKNILTRLLNYYSYPVSANKYIKTLDSSFDIVFANQTSPIMMVNPAINYAKKYNKKVVLYCMDLWPATLLSVGVKKETLIYKHFYKVSKKIYNNVDLILVSSKMFKEYFVSEFNIEKNKIDYLPQFALDVFNVCSEENNKYENKKTLDLVFAGNIGKLQNIYVILRAAKIIKNKNILPDNKKILFHIVGDGQELNNLILYSKKERLENVIFYGRKPVEEMPKYYKLADAMLVSFIDDNILSMTLPAKIQSYMSFGKPIIGSANGEINSIINESKCGFCANANDEYDLVDKIIEFSKSDKIILGNNSKIYYKQNFDVNMITDKLEKLLYKYSIL